MEMKTIWKILHLDTPTTDIGKIKQAYSQQTKTCNPEDNPEEFQNLYNAYKQAIKYAKGAGNSSSNTKVKIEEYQSQQVQDLNSKNNDFIDDKKENLKERAFSKRDSDEKNVSEEFQNLNSKSNNFNYDEKENLKESDPFKRDSDEELNVPEEENKISDIVEELNSFRELNFEDNESTRIQKMMTKIDQGIKGGNKQLKEIMSSKEFFELLNEENFQLVLSKYLNNRLKLGTTKTYIIRKSLKKYIKKYGRKNLTNSLNNYFNIIRKKRTPYYYPLVIFLRICTFYNVGIYW